MNRIKARYRFVDLLKPETEAVVPLLLTLEPSRRGVIEEILKAAPIMKAKGEHGLAEPTLPKVPGDMARGGESYKTEHPTLDDVLSDALGEVAGPFVTRRSTQGDMGRTPVSSTTGDLGARDTFQRVRDWLEATRRSWADSADNASSWASLALARGDDEERLRSASTRHSGGSPATTTPS